MRNLCIIPARGGSKRILRKNIKPFLGKPIVTYSIKAALDSGLFNEVMVSTDDSEIAEIAKKCGATVPFFRSKKNSDDFATTYDVIKEVIENYKKQEQEFDNLCCIYSCAPFVSANTLKLGFSKLIDENLDSVFPIISFSFPIQRALCDNDGKISMIEEKYLNVRSQDLKKRYHDAGQFYWCNTVKLMESKKLLTSNTGGIIISELDAQDIDTETDWKLAELKYQLSK